MNLSNTSIEAIRLRKLQFEQDYIAGVIEELEYHPEIMASYTPEVEVIHNQNGTNIIVKAPPHSEGFKLNSSITKELQGESDSLQDYEQFKAMAYIVISEENQETIRIRSFHAIENEVYPILNAVLLRILSRQAIKHNYKIVMCGIPAQDHNRQNIVRYNGYIPLSLARPELIDELRDKGNIGEYHPNNIYVNIPLNANAENYFHPSVLKLQPEQKRAAQNIVANLETITEELEARLNCDALDECSECKRIKFLVEFLRRTFAPFGHKIDSIVDIDPQTLPTRVRSIIQQAKLFQYQILTDPQNRTIETVLGEVGFSDLY